MIKRSTGQDTCDITCYDPDKIDRITNQIDQDRVQKMSILFKGLAEPSRMTIMRALMIEAELCVCDVASLLQAPVANASHHLRSLHRIGLVKHRKDGKLVWYSLDDEHVRSILQLAMVHEEETEAPHVQA
jgi:DNA-binding transcriptional ArsR family regulator